MNTMKEIEKLWERYRLSGKKKLWKIDIAGWHEQELLISEIVREGKKEFASKLKELGIINLNAVGEFSVREKEILEARFFELKNLEEVGKKFGVTRERVRQIETKALERLRFNNYYGKENKL